MREMNKLFIGGIAALALVLSGCTTTPEATPTVTQTVTADPSPSSNTSLPAQGTQSDFIFLMESVGTPSYFLEGEALDILIGQARSVCGLIDDGMSRDDIVWAVTLAASESGATDDVVDAFLAASVAGTYVYCPQHENFFG